MRSKLSESRSLLELVLETVRAHTETPAPAPSASPVFATVTAKQRKSLNKKFSSCKSLNAVFPGGIASTKGAVNSGAKTKYLAVIHAGTYKLNKSLDRDKDLIICER
jgi:hypothetical protein